MAYTYSDYENYYGMPNGPNVQQVRENQALSTSSIVSATGYVVGEPSALLLGPASGEPNGTENSYYLIWGMLAASTDNDPSIGFVFQATDGVAYPSVHTAITGDESVLFGIGFNQKGPFSWSSNQPIRVASGQGLKYESANNAGGREMLTVMYSIVHPDLG